MPAPGKELDTKELDIMTQTNETAPLLNELLQKYWQHIIIERNKRLLVTWAHRVDELAKEYGITPELLRFYVARTPCPQLSDLACKACGKTGLYTTFQAKTRSEWQELVRHLVILCPACWEVEQKRLQEEEERQRQLTELERQERIRQAEERKQQAVEKHERLKARYGARYFADCPSCEGILIARRNKRGGLFVGCSSYPECEYVTQFPKTDVTDFNDAELAEMKKAFRNTLCPQCGAAVIKRIGKYGEFWGCLAWPRCRFTESIAVVKEDEMAYCGA